MKLAVLGAVLLVAGCASAPPDGPGVLVLPGSTKSFDQFRADDFACRQYASQSIGGKTPRDAAHESGVASAAVGTVIGTAAGAALGGSEGARVGAGLGLAGGALVGADKARYSGYTLQQRYDFGYQQCMYAQGHKIPMTRAQAARERYSGYTLPPPPPPR